MPLLRVHGQVISPEVQAFRAKWFSSEEATRELKEKQNLPNQYDQISADNLTEIRPGLAEVNLAPFTAEWEDADTLLLNSPWYKFWKDPVAIRLTGIDAPEIEHPDDPTSWFRYHQAQPHGMKSKRAVEEFSTGKQLRVFVGTGKNQQTYGRYLGFVTAGEDVVNIEAVRRGWAAALPFGEAGSDILDRQELMRLEREASGNRLGMWAEPFFQKYLDISRGLEGRLTFNTLTDLSRLSKNYHLAAAESYLSNPEAQRQPGLGKYLGKKLIPSYGRFFSANHGAYNTIPGMQHTGMSSEMRKIDTDFGSRSDPLRAIARGVGIMFEDLLKSPEWKEALGKAQFVKKLGKGSFGEAQLFRTTIHGEEVNLVRKTIHEEAVQNVEILAQQHAARWNVPMEEARKTYERSLNLEREAGFYHALGETPSVPSAYGLTNKKQEMWMEFMQGSELAHLTEAQPRMVMAAKARRDLEETLSTAIEKGIYNPDIHAGNVLYDPLRQRATLLDFGQARVQELSAREAEIMRGRLMEVPGVYKAKTPIETGGLLAKEEYRQDLRGGRPQAAPMKQVGPEAVSAPAKPRAKKKLLQQQQAQDLQRAKQVSWQAAHNGGNNHIVRGPGQQKVDQISAFADTLLRGPNGTMIGH